MTSKGFSTVSIRDCFDVILSGVDKKTHTDERPVLLCNYTDVYHNRQITHSLNFMKGSATESEIEKLTLCAGDIVITKDSETPSDIAVPAYVPQDMQGVVCAYHLAILRPNSADVCSKYVAYLLQEQRTRYYFFTLANGATRFGLNQKAITSAKIDLPCFAQQALVSHVLESWDQAIELTEKLIAAKLIHKQALMQHIFQNCCGTSTQLSKVLKRVRHPVSPEAVAEYRQIGIRSHGKGIFHKPPVTGASLGNKRVYEIKPDCFVFNVVFAWEQAVARTTANEIGMIASHRFPMYEPIDDLVDIDFLLYFFKTKKGKHLLGLASPGGAGRNRTLSQAAFLKLKVFLPSKIEQIQQANVLRSADREIALLEQRTDLLKRQKKGLMQQLLTGKIRVKLPKAKRKK